MTSTDENTVEYKEGHHVGYQDLPPTNKYEQGTESHARWQHGYEVGEAERIFEDNAI